MRETPMPFRVFISVMNLFAAPPARAAVEVVALIAGGVTTANGQFFHRGRTIASPDYAHDEAAQERLWRASEQLCGPAS